VLGKVANCQTLVTAQYIADAPTTSTPIHWPVTAQLYVPTAWLTDPTRRVRARIPDTVHVHRKHDVALAVIDRARAWDVPFRLVLADAGYGRIAAFIKGLEERHLLYVCGVDKAFGVRRPEDVVRAQLAAVPRPSGKAGRPCKAHPAPLAIVRKVFADLPATHWQTITWRDGSRSPMRKQFVALRMHWGTGEEARSTDDPRVYTSPEGWLIGARSIDGQTEETKYYFSTLPADTPLTQLAAFVRARWPIEQFYEEAKQECGLGDYQGRRWDGLHRHVALVMLAYSFLVYQRMTTEECRAGHFLPSVRRHSLAALHRTVLVWLLHDFVHWWVRAGQGDVDRPRRE